MAGHSQAQLDTFARQLGYNDYAHYQAFQQHQALMQQTQPPAVQGAPGAAPAQPQQPQNNWLQSLIMNSPLGYVARKFNGQ